MIEMTLGQMVIATFAAVKGLTPDESDILWRKFATIVDPTTTHVTSDLMMKLELLVNDIRSDRNQEVILKNIPPVPTTEREPECVERWPECSNGGYDPRCCRFPKSCSVKHIPTMGD